MSRFVCEPGEQPTIRPIELLFRFWRHHPRLTVVREQRPHRRPIEVQFCFHCDVFGVEDMAQLARACGRDVHPPLDVRFL